MGMIRHGFVTGYMDPDNFRHLRDIVLQTPMRLDGTITGKYQMSKIEPNSLYASARDFIASFEELASRYLSFRFPSQPITIEMDESAILVNPSSTHGQSEKAQICHADDISGTGVTFIISLTDNCLSTYCLSTTLYGPDYPTSLSPERLIGCNYFKSKNRKNQDILAAVSARYRPVCMGPNDFFQKAEGGQPVRAGHYTAFSHDTMHAGPSGNEARQVLFLHFRVKSKVQRPLTNIQYRIDALMQVCGYSETERQAIYSKWDDAGHWSPYESA